MDTLTGATALIQTAKNVLSTEGSPDERLTLIESYTKDFDIWFSSNQTKLAALAPEQRSIIDELVGLHDRVADLVDDLHAQSSEEMRQLRQKGKGLIAYTDTLPKQISTRLPRKG